MMQWISVSDFNGDSNFGQKIMARTLLEVLYKAKIIPLALYRVGYDGPLADHS